MPSALRSSTGVGTSTRVLVLIQYSARTATHSTQQVKLARKNEMRRAIIQMSIALGFPRSIDCLGTGTSQISVAYSPYTCVAMHAQQQWKSKARRPRPTRGLTEKAQQDTWKPENVPVDRSELDGQGKGCDVASRQYLTEPVPVVPRNTNRRCRIKPALH